MMMIEDELHMAWGYIEAAQYKIGCPGFAELNKPIRILRECNVNLYNISKELYKDIKKLRDMAEESNDSEKLDILDNLDATRLKLTDRLIWQD